MEKKLKSTQWQEEEDYEEYDGRDSFGAHGEDGFVYYQVIPGKKTKKKKKAEITGDDVLAGKGSEILIKDDLIGDLVYRVIKVSPMPKRSIEMLGKYSYELHNDKEGRTKFPSQNEMKKNIESGKYVIINKLYSEGGLYKKGGKISKTEKAFGALNFDQLEKIFRVRLYGLDEESTEDMLDELRDEWKEKSEEEREEILDEYGVQYKTGGLIEGFVSWLNKDF